MSTNEEQAYPNRARSEAAVPGGSAERSEATLICKPRLLRELARKRAVRSTRG